MIKKIGIFALTGLLSQASSALVFQLDFSATASSIINDGHGYDIGDSITSSFTIDLSAAGADGSPPTGNARSFWNRPFFSSDPTHTDHSMVQSDLISPLSTPDDSILVLDDRAAPPWLYFPTNSNETDVFNVSDSSLDEATLADGSVEYNFRIANFYMSTEFLDWIDSVRFEEFNFEISDASFLDEFSHFSLSDVYSLNGPSTPFGSGPILDRRENTTRFTIDAVSFSRVVDVQEPETGSLFLLSGILLFTRRFLKR